MSTAGKKTVYFDGSCSLCRREISFYRTCKGASQVVWVDASCATPEELGPDLSQDAAMARFHLRDEQNRLITGGAAFTEVWSVLSAFRPLALIFQLPIMRAVLEWSYTGFLRVRPALQRFVASRDDKNKPSSS